MNLRLESYRVVDMDLRNAGKSISEPTFSMQVGLGFSDDERNKRRFVVGFKIAVGDRDMDLKMEMQFVFVADSDIDRKFKDSDFPKVNAPAIAFPYLRAFVSNLTMQAGYSTLILPSVNFVSFSKSNAPYDCPVD